MTFLLGSIPGDLPAATSPLYSLGSKEELVKQMPVFNEHGIVGGALYSIGGVLYALKWPNPWPTTFGHHEFFHTCTAVAAICHYIAMWFAVFN